ncbi:uncharacterized protein VTP21DRAFT_9536 [Calcarisporiella thermophila]|uniref:uncharacterized protein n=1 Tax=Calcarisporiella thermophila TaxID=911321 RepID=UPI0037421A30
MSNKRRRLEIPGLIHRRTLDSVPTKHVYKALIHDSGPFKHWRQVDMKGHYSCVNTLGFSHGDAKFLVSGGDDKRCLLWDMYGDLSNAKPIKHFRGHQSIIFCIVFDNSNRHIISCGNDGLILRYDLEGAATPNEVLMEHEASVQEVSISPDNDDILLSASMCQDTLYNRYRGFGAEMCGVQFNPTIPNHFVSCDAKGQILLRDLRMSFKKNRARRPTRDDDSSILVRYATKLVHNNQYTIPDVSSVSFSRDGKRLCASLHRFQPTLYNTNDPAPVCIFSSPMSRKHGYKNSCTVKHGNFGGPDDEYFLSGSDDFRIYAWNVPELLGPARSLDEMPTFTSDAHSSSSADLFVRPPVDKVLYMGKDESTDKTSVYHPVNVGDPAFVLSGHRSVVNQVRWHPHLPLLFSSGVEKIIKVHSIFPFGNEDETSSSTSSAHVRQRFPANREMRHSILNPLIMFMGDESPPSDEGETSGEDVRTLALFDMLLAQEENDGLEWHNLNASDSSDEDEAMFIGIDEVRELANFFSRRSNQRQRGGEEDDDDDDDDDDEELEEGVSRGENSSGRGRSKNSGCNGESHDETNDGDGEEESTEEKADSDVALEDAFHDNEDE